MSARPPCLLLVIGPIVAAMDLLHPVCFFFLFSFFFQSYKGNFGFIEKSLKEFLLFAPCQGGGLQFLDSFEEGTLLQLKV
jgi:hypothetical protein